MKLKSLFVVAFVMIAPATAAKAFPIVRIDAGQLIGRTLDGVDSFKGVPYAGPAGGANRWRPPQPVAPWRLPRDAGAVGAMCVQPYRRTTGCRSRPLAARFVDLSQYAASQRFSAVVFVSFNRVTAALNSSSP